VGTDLLVTVVALLLVAALAVVTAQVWRRVQAIRAGGVQVAVRVPPGGPVQRWHTGIGRYRGDEFLWLRLSGLGTRPNEVLHRRDVEVIERRRPEAQEAAALPAGVTVLVFSRPAAQDVEIAMEPGALTGFLSWLESAPPGHGVPWTS